jgi:hypothetical protein
MGGYAMSAFQATASRWLAFSIDQIKNPHAPDGTLGEPWPIGTASLWAAILLIAYLLLAYL